MSCYEWESGEIVIPKAKWAEFRKAIIKAHNDALLKRYETTCAAFEAAEAKVKGLRGENRTKAFEEAFAEYFGGKKGQWGGYNFPMIKTGYGWNATEYNRRDEWEGCVELACPWKANNEKEWAKPKKKDLKILPLSESATIRLDGSTIRLDNDSHTVEWSVEENNRACDRERQKDLAKVLFSLLAKMEWTRGSGGTIVGNDEYNRDDRNCGGGGNYLKETFGPGGKAVRERYVMGRYY